MTSDDTIRTAAESCHASSTESLLVSEGSSPSEQEEDDNRNLESAPVSFSSSLTDSLKFFHTFVTAKGTIRILIISTLVAFSMGSVVGIVPDVVSDRYARLRYEYQGPGCTSYDRLDKPDACQRGADDAQGAAASATMALNMLTLVFNPMVGSFSDCRGRRGVIFLSLMLYALGPIVFVALQLCDWLSPNFYYVAVSLSGAVDFTSMTFAALSDVLPVEGRAAGYGIVLSGYYVGFTFAPSLPMLLSHFHVSIFSCTAALLALFMALLVLPETLPESVAEENLRSLEERETAINRTTALARNDSGSGSGSSYSEDGHSPFLSADDNAVQQATQQRHWLVRILQTATRPLRDMEILKRGNLPILAAGSFFSAMVYSSDKSLVLYYIEDQLNVRDKDLARMFLIFGSIGIIIQAFLLQPMLRIVGEKQLLVITFISGTCHNALYGLARNKSVILIALCLSQLTKVNFPILSSYASRGASPLEQGRVQGALFALNALANAAGPMLLESVYNHTKDGQCLLGPGTMFIFASFIYGLGTIMVTFLPNVDAATASSRANSSDDEEICFEHPESVNSLQEPLLSE